MWGLIARGAWLAAKFALKRPLTSIVGADMATGGHSTDALLDSAEATGKIIGKDNAKTIGLSVAGIVGAFNESAARIAGKTLGRVGTAVKDDLASKAGTLAAAESSAPAGTPASTPTPAPKTETKTGDRDDKKTSLTNTFDFAAKGGLGALLGGMTGNPVMMIFGAILAIFMMGKMFGGDKDDKTAPKHHHPAPAP